MEAHRLGDGRTVHYDLRRQSDGAAPPVVFLNGLSQTAVVWGLQTQRLRGVRDVLLFDAAGQGQSDPPPVGSRPADHARDLLHLLRALGFDHVDVVGFSFGGRIALRLMLAAPEIVRRAVLIGCAHRETVLRRWIVQGWVDALERGGMEHCFQVVTPMIVGERWLARNEAARANMLRAFVRRNHPESVRRLLEDSLLEGGDLAEELRALPHPTLVVRGSDDLVVPRELCEELVALLPDSRFVEADGCGHSVAIERPNWLAERLRAHLVADSRN